MAAGDVLEFARTVGEVRAFAHRAKRRRRYAAVMIFIATAPDEIGIIGISKAAFLTAISAKTDHEPMAAELRGDGDGGAYIAIGSYSAIERAREAA